MHIIFLKICLQKRSKNTHEKSKERGEGMMGGTQAYQKICRTSPLPHRVVWYSRMFRHKRVGLSDRLKIFFFFGQTNVVIPPVRLLAAFFGELKKKRKQKKHFFKRIPGWGVGGCDEDIVKHKVSFRCSRIL